MAENTKKSNEWLVIKIKENKINDRYKSQLIKNNKSFIYKIIGRIVFDKSKFDIDELLSVGNMSMLKSVSFFDISKNIKFTTYSYSIIKRDLISYVNKETYANYMSSKYNDCKLSNPTSLNCDIKLIVENIFNGNILNEIEKRILEYKFGLNGKSLLKRSDILHKINEEFFKDRNIHINTIDNYTKNALRKIKQYMEK